MEMHLQIAKLEKKLACLQRERDVILNELFRIKEDQKFETTTQGHKRMVRMIVELENDLEIELATTETIKTGISTVKKHSWNELRQMDMAELKERKQKLEERITRSRLNEPGMDEEISEVPFPSTSGISQDTSTEDESLTDPSATNTSESSVDPVTLDLKWQEGYSTVEDESDDDTYSSCYTSPLDTSFSSY